MRILFISRMFYPEVIGGGQISPFYLARNLIKQGNDVSVLTFTAKKEYKENLEGVKITRKHIKKLRFFWRLSNLDYMYWQIAKNSIEQIKKIKPDVIHLLNFESIHYSSFILKKKFPTTPIFTTVNGPCFACFTGNAIDYNEETCINCKPTKRLICCMNKWGKIRGSLYFIYSIWYMALLKFSYRYVDRFFPVSKAMIPLLLNMGVPMHKIKVVHNPIDMAEKIKTNLKKKLSIAKDQKVILYAGRIAKEKGIHRTIKAMQSIDKAVLLVVGRENEYSNELKELVKRLNLGDKVKFFGFVEHHKIVEYYSIADLVVLACEFFEPLSRMLLESCSYGIPIITSDRGGNSEIVENGKNGILLKTYKTEELVGAIKKVFRDDGFHEMLSKGCKEKMINEFSPILVGNQIKDIYYDTYNTGRYKIDRTRESKVFALQNEIRDRFAAFLDGETLDKPSRILYPLLKRNINTFNRILILCKLVQEEYGVGLNNSIIAIEKVNSRKSISSKQYLSILDTLYAEFYKNVPKFKIKVKSKRIKNLKSFKKWKEEVKDKKYLSPIISLHDAIQGFSANLSGFFISGSISTLDYIKGWSDLDTLVIVKKNTIKNPKSLMKMRDVLYKSRSFFDLIDPLQHHGHSIISEYEMDLYSQRFMPFDVYKYSTSILGKIELNFKERKSLKESNNISLRYLNQLVKISKGQSPPPKNMFMWKEFIHRILVLPAVYLQSKGQPCYKKHSFKIAKGDFSDNEWKIIDTATEIRKEWSYNALLPLSLLKLALKYPNPFLFKIRHHLLRGRIPKEIKRYGVQKLLNETGILAKATIKKLEKQND